MPHRDMAHRATNNGARRALNVNENRTRMHNRAIVYVRVCVIRIRMCAYMAPHCGCVWCGRRDADYAAHIRLRLDGVIAHELVVACSTG